MIVPLLAYLGAVLLALYFAFSWDAEDRKCRITKEKVPHATLWSIFAPLVPCFRRSTQVTPEHNIEMTTINNHEGSESATSVALSSDDIILRKEWKRRERKAFQEKQKGKSVGSEHSILDDALPEVFRSNTYIEKLTAELKRHHRWFNILYHYSEVYPRALRVLSLATNIITTLFFIAITYSIANPDENNCNAYSNKDDCLEPKSHFHTGQPQCRWDNNNAVQCSFVQPSVLIRVILFVVIFAVMLAIPVNTVTNYLIQYVLAAPIKVTDHAKQHNASSKYQVKDTGDTEPNEAALNIPVYSSTPDNDQYIQNENNFTLEQDRIKPLSDLHSPMASPPVSPTNDNNDPISTYQQVTDLLRGKLDVTTVTTPLLAKYKSHRDRAHQELALLQNDVRKHRTTYMTGVLDRRKFDRVWSLSSTGLFLTPEPLKASDGCFHRCAHVVARSCCCSCIFTDPAQARVELYQDILRALQAEKREIARIKAHSLSEPEIGRMLLLQLHVDLLPTTAGNILACKGKRDQPAVLPIHWWYKVLAWVVILAVNWYFLYTLFGFAATQSSARRTAWFKSFMLFIVMDCVGVATNRVLATHVLVPCLALSEVQRVKEYLIHKLQQHDIDTQKTAAVNAQLGRRPIRNGASAVVKNEPVTAPLTLAPPPVITDVESGSTALSFNAAKYLYTSYRLSVYFPALYEAQIVQFFVLQMPRPAQLIEIVEEMRLVNELKNENSASSPKRKSYVCACNVLTMLLHMAYVCVLPLVHLVLLLPLYLQDALLDYITIVLFGYFLLLHMILYAFYPPLAFVPPFVGSVLAHFIIVSGNSAMQTKLANLKKQTLAARQEARKLNNRRAQHEAGDAKNVTPYEVAQKKVVTIVVSAAPASGSNIPNNTLPAGGLQQQQPSAATPSDVKRSNVLSPVAEASQSSAPQTPYTTHTPYTPSPAKGSKGPAPSTESPVKGPASYAESPVKGPALYNESPVKGPAPAHSPTSQGPSAAAEERDSRLKNFFSSADKVLHTHLEHDPQDTAAVTKAVNAVTAASKDKPQHTTTAAEDKSDISSSMTSMNTSFNTVMQPHQSWSNLKAGEKYSPTGKAATAGGAPSPNRANRLVKKASRPASTFMNGASGGAP